MPEKPVNLRCVASRVARRAFGMRSAGCPGTDTNTHAWIVSGLGGSTGRTAAAAAGILAPARVRLAPRLGVRARALFLDLFAFALAHICMSKVYV